jgi:L-ascorbate metabolism protein UlaG (beta-lactamase superfamily)
MGQIRSTAAALSLLAGVALFTPEAEARGREERCSAPEAPAGPPPSPGRLQITFMGATTLLFDDGATQILIDGYFSRPPLIAAALGVVEPNCTRIEQAIRRSGILKGRLKAILVAHSHVDHALDSAEVAMATGADLIGSPSVEQIAVGHGLRDSKNAETHCDPCLYDGFTILAIRTPHSEPNVVKGKIEAPVPRRAWTRRYRAEDSHAFLIEHGGLRFLVYPGAAYEPGRLHDVAADVVFLGSSGLGRKRQEYVDAYWAEVVDAVGARLVYPIHWDNFGRPLHKGLRPMPWPLDDVPRGMDRLEALARAHEVALGELSLFRKFDARLELEAATAPVR